MNNNINTKNIISIIIPVYNCEKYLDRCLNSIVSQSYKEIEIILIDDGSTDNSFLVCNKWANQDRRITVIHQNNQGISAARNAGLDIANGQYIMFVDADDYIDNNLCQILFDEINMTKNADCVICGVSYFDDNGHIGAPKVVPDKLFLTGIDLIKDAYVFNRNRISVIVSWGKLYKRDIWKNLRFINGLYYEDLDIMPYIYTQCNLVVCVPYIGYYYYQRIGSISHGIGTDNKRIIDSIFIREKHIDFFERINEFDIANNIRKKELDLIITSAINSWTPLELNSNYKKMYNNHYKYVIKKSSLKEIIRYTVYRIGGAKLYKIIKKLF